VPERFGCCHGSDQARGVIASFVRRAFGRTSLRGVARIRQAALAAILGGATYADSFADGEMAGAENAWDAPGGHVHGGAPPQLQTGGGTSPRLLALRLAHSSLDQHLRYVVFRYCCFLCVCLHYPTPIPLRRKSKNRKGAAKWEINGSTQQIRSSSARDRLIKVQGG